VNLFLERIAGVLLLQPKSCVSKAFSKVGISNYKVP
jgi:hypothetical protein